MALGLEKKLFRIHCVILLLRTCLKTELTYDISRPFWDIIQVELRKPDCRHRQVYTHVASNALAGIKNLLD